MRFIALIFIASALLFSCNESQYEEQASSFITTLGEDTLVFESFIIDAEKTEAEILMRSPRTVYMKQRLLCNSDGSFKEFLSSSFDPQAIDGKALSEQFIKVEDDSLLITTQRDTSIRTRKLAYDPSIIPWFDMVHWPYEVATKQMVKEGKQSVDQLMLTGRRTGIFEIRSIEEDSISIKHPYRGTMYARIREDGALLNYNATQTTRKLIVQRKEGLDIKALAAKYADKPIGSLSGEGKTEVIIMDANIELTFGQPARRGRKLFGGIVPYGRRWRTGANRATHFKTDKDLRFGELDVPAGEYTLFTIPEMDGGTLIINKQTGQNGNSYDETQDVGRVQMGKVENKTSVELFTIDAIERGDKGFLQLKWGETILEAEFEVMD